MTNHPNRNPNIAVTNAEIFFSVRDGRLHGRCTISDTTQAATGALTSSSPVHNNFWSVSGVFATEAAAAEAARDYLKHEGPVWGIDNGYSETVETDTEVVFSKPKINKKANPHLIVRKLCI